jgi:ABC-2 type transport system permease protein
VSRPRVTRFHALVSKEFLDLRRNATALVPVAIVTFVSLAMPFLIVFAIPAATGQPLGDDADLVGLSRVFGHVAGLSDNGRVQVFLLQQFLMLFLLTPITGAMSLAAHAVVGEKQARTLEPLLATPVTTVELLLAKVLGALVPTALISGAGVVLYLAVLPFLTEPGVVAALLNARTFALVLVVAPSAGLVALQTAILVSSRVNDPRTAQQFGVLIVVPLMGVLIAQFSGALWLSASALTAIGVGLLAVWLLLTALSVAVFDRETILTRWR